VANHCTMDGMIVGSRYVLCQPAAATDPRVTLQESTGTHSNIHLIKSTSVIEPILHTIIIQFPSLVTNQASSYL